MYAPHFHKLYCVLSYQCPRFCEYFWSMVLTAWKICFWIFLYAPHFYRLDCVLSYQCPRFCEYFWSMVLTAWKICFWIFSNGSMIICRKLLKTSYVKCHSGIRCPIIYFFNKPLSVLRCLHCHCQTRSYVAQ